MGLSATTQPGLIYQLPHRPTRRVEPERPNSAKLGYHSIGVYVQDTWKVSRRFTLDYGLRYDYQTYMTEQYGR